MKKLALASLIVFVGFVGSGMTQSMASSYTFKGGYPTPETVQRAYDDADLNRAIQAYRVFYPTVSGAAIFKGNAKIGVIPNKSFGTLDTQPKHVGYTLNSDTPYAPLLLDLTDGPMVIDMPAGPLICVAMDLNQRWVADMGLPGPDAGKGGKHLLLPPGYKGEVPSGYHTATSTTYRMLVGVRSLPVGGDVPAAIERIKTVKSHPLNASSSWTEPRWLDLTPPPQDTTPLAWEDNLQYWQVLHEVVESEPPFEGYRDHYGELAVLGITKGQPFAPDARMKRILEQAAQMASAQMRVESFADRRPDRVVWKDRQWEWAALRFEDGDFNAPNYADTYARDKWYFQAIGSSPAMFRRDAGAGSLYWLGLRDKAGVYLDGGKTYKLTVPQPVPGKLFWSAVVYDRVTHALIRNVSRASRSSQSQGLQKNADGSVDVYFGPEAPAGKESNWVPTSASGKFEVLFRFYGPEKPLFDKTWKLPDIEPVVAH